MASKVAIEVEIKNIKQVADLKKSLKALRKETSDYEKEIANGKKATKESTKGYIDSSKAIKNQSKELRNLKKGLNDSNKATKEVTKSSNGMAKQFLKGAAAIGIVVGAFRTINRAVSSVVSTFSDFEFVMAKVNAVSGATESEFVALTKSAEDLGRSTFFTATQVGELQLAYSKLGFTAQEILDATEATLDLATATGTDLARAAQVAGASIRGFQLDASEAGRVVDVMAVAFSSSALDIEKWNTSMTKVAPIAAMAGFEIEEVAAIMGKLSDTGIEASIAGTSLRNIFLKMQDPSSKLSKTLGHTITNLDEMLIAFKGLQDEGTDLTDVLGFMDIRQVAAFGTMLQGSDDIATLRDSLLEASGEGERMADIVGDTLQGSMLKFTSAAQGAAIAVMKNFGGGLKKTFSSLAKFLNKLVENEGAMAKLTSNIKLAAEWIGFTAKALLSYVVGAKLAAMWTATTSSAFFTMMTASQRAATGVRVLTISLRTFTSALITTGVGALVVALGFLVSKMFEAKDVIASIPTTLESVDKAMLDTAKKTKGLEKELESLSKVRGKMISLSEEEGKDLKENSKLSYAYTELKKKEKLSISNINKVMKVHNQDLVTEKDNIEDITTATNTLIESINKKAYANIYTDMRASILKSEVEGDLLLKQINKLQTAETDHWKVSTDIADVIKDVEDDYTQAWHDFSLSGSTTVRANRVVAVKKLLEDMDMTIQEFKESIQGGSFDSKIAELEETISSKLGGISITDLLSGEATEEKVKPESKAAQFEINEMIRKREVFFRENNAMLDNDKLFNAGLLEAKIAGVQDFLNQENNKKEGVEIADRQMAGLLRKQRKSNNASTLQDLRTTATEDINFQKTLLKTKIINEFDYAKKVIEIKQTLLKDELAILEKGQGNEKAIADNKSKMLTLELQKDKLNIKEKERIIKKAFDDKVLTLELEQSTTMMNKVEFDNRMLALEFDYLMARKGLYETGALELIDINNGILANNVSVNEQQKQLMQEQISAYGGVGSALTTLAGDNENLNAIKEAGNAISQAANIISTITTLKENLSTIAKVGNTAAVVSNTVAEGVNATATGVSTAMTLADTTANAVQIPFLATKSILKSGSSLPFPLNLIAIAATIAVISKVMKMFEKGGIVSDGKYERGGLISKFANGGMVHGASHAQGGVKFAVGGRVNELEGGEAVINKRSTAMFKSQLSSMNEAGGGVKFANGGLLNNPTFAQQKFSQGNSGGSAQRVFVVEADISQSQNSVSVLEAAATI